MDPPAALRPPTGIVRRMRRAPWLAAAIVALVALASWTSAQATPSTIAPATETPGLPGSDVLLTATQGTVASTPAIRSARPDLDPTRASVVVLLTAAVALVLVGASQLRHRPLRLPTGQPFERALPPRGPPSV